jgi:hypothetical protein
MQSYFNYYFKLTRNNCVHAHGKKTNVIVDGILTDNVY